jgi:hypothetical protein
LDDVNGRTPTGFWFVFMAFLHSPGALLGCAVAMLFRSANPQLELMTGLVR